MRKAYGTMTFTHGALWYSSTDEGGPRCAPEAVWVGLGLKGEQESGDPEGGSLLPQSVSPLLLSLSEPQGCLLRLEDDAVLAPSDPVLLQLAPVSPPSPSHRLRTLGAF